MKKLLFILATCLISTPALARPATTAVGPYSVETRVSELGSTLSVDGKISGGTACESMLINVQMAETKSGQTAAANANLARYRGNRDRFSADASIQRTTGLTEWFISDITIQCINKGVATRYSANP